MTVDVSESARRALDEWYALDSKDGLGPALYVASKLAAVLEVLTTPRPTTSPTVYLRDSVATSLCRMYCGPAAWDFDEGTHSKDAHRLDADYLIARFDMKGRDAARAV